VPAWPPVALQHDLESLFPLDAGNDADDTGLRFQHRPLLDVRFHVGGQRKAEWAPPQRGECGVQCVERVGDAGAGRIARGADRVQAAHAGEGFGAHHARGKA
jgi:hypothetical protein